MTLEDFVTTGDIVRLSGASGQSVRRACDRFGDQIPRVGQYRMIPRSLVPQIMAMLPARPSTKGRELARV